MELLSASASPPPDADPPPLAYFTGPPPSEPPENNPSPGGVPLANNGAIGEDGPTISASGDLKRGIFCGYLKAAQRASGLALFSRRDRTLLAL
jgi:hypothetical protein